MARLALRGIDRLLSLLGRMRPIHVEPISGGRMETPAQDPTASPVHAWWAMLHRRNMAEASAKLRFPHEPRNMATWSKVEGDASGKLDSERQLSPFSDNIMVSMGTEHSAITQGMKNQQDVEGYIPRNVIYSDDKSPARVTLEIVDARHGLRSLIHISRTQPAVQQYFSLTINQPYESAPAVISTSKHSHDTKEIAVITPHESCSDDDCLEEAPVPDGVHPLETLRNSSHRDGSIYKGMWDWFCVSDRIETRLEAMMLSEDKDCAIRDGRCHYHGTIMLQIFSLKLAKVPMGCGSIELYGYIAVRDRLDKSLNYVINYSRDDPIRVEQGCLLNMSGPKRGIKFIDDLLIEYDMRIKTQGKVDLQLIDGASMINNICDTWLEDTISTGRIQGDGGAIDMTASSLGPAVEATIEVLISQVQSGFNLYLGCFTSGMLEEILLFDGAICEPGGLNRSVVAVLMDTGVDLELKVGTGLSIPVHHCCSFRADVHGYSTQEIKTNFALISVKNSLQHFATFGTPGGALGEIIKSSCICSLRKLGEIEIVDITGVPSLKAFHTKLILSRLYLKSYSVWLVVFFARRSLKLDR